MILEKCIKLIAKMYIIVLLFLACLVFHHVVIRFLKSLQWEDGEIQDIVQPDCQTNKMGGHLQPLWWKTCKQSIADHVHWNMLNCSPRLAVKREGANYWILEMKQNETRGTVPVWHGYYGSTNQVGGGASEETVKSTHAWLIGLAISFFQFGVSSNIKL